MSDTRDRNPADSIVRWVGTPDSRRAAEQTRRWRAATFGPPNADRIQTGDGLDDRRVEAMIRWRLGQDITVPPPVFPFKFPDPDRLDEEIDRARYFVLEHINVWLTAAEAYLGGVPARPCCQTTGDFVRQRSDVPGDFDACVRCRCMLVAHEVAWQAALRALPLDLSVEPGPPLDENAARLPRALLRLALEIDTITAQRRTAPSDEGAEPRIPIASGARSLWNWLATLGPMAVLPGVTLPRAPIMLGPVLGSFQITRVVSSKLMEVSMPLRPKRTTLTRTEIYRAVSEHRRRCRKPAPR